MSAFVDQTMQYLAAVVENAAVGSRSIDSPTSFAHSMPLPHYARGLVTGGSESPPCSPLVLSSPSFYEDLLDFCDQPSNLQPSEPSTSLGFESPLERSSFCDAPHSEADASLLSPAPDYLRPGPARLSASVLLQPSSSAFADDVSSNLPRSQADPRRFEERTPSDEPDQSLESAVYALADEALSASRMQWQPAVSGVFCTRALEDWLIERRFPSHRTRSKNTPFRKL